MKRILSPALLSLLLLAPALLTAQEPIADAAGAFPAVVSRESLREELRRDPRKSGSVYLVYPDPPAVRPALPEGFEPVYVSHYGRHGSRWITTDERYTAVLHPFEAAHASRTLTPLGEDVLQRLRRVWADAEGRGGDLSPVGERQHRAIAQRLCRACPALFGGDSVRIEAVASLSPRCILSMAAFTEALKEYNPTLQIRREASRRTMQYVAYTSPEAEAFGSEDAPWRADFHAFEAARIRPQRLMAALFTDPGAVDAPGELMMGLYWIASDMQDVEVGENFYDLFTDEELFGIWECINNRMYLCNADAPLNGGIAVRSAVSLLREVVDAADRALAEGVPGATLRFGHDTNLIRLLALMQSDRCSGRTEDPERYAEVWQDFRVVPMAANLQLIFGRNAAGEVVVQLLHNERLTRLPVETPYEGCYPWPVLRAYFEERLAECR